MILPYMKKKPMIHSTAFIAPNAVIVGDVIIGKDSSVWFYSVVRGDVHYIRIGNRTNVQDGCILHVTNGTHPLEIGDEVTIGHGAILHGCTIKERSLIGLGARVLDGALIGPESMVAAGAVVKEGFVVPSGTLVAGVPARVIRDLTPEEKEKIATSASNYVRYSQNYLWLEELENG